MPQNALPTSVPRYFAWTGSDYSQSVPTTPVPLIPANRRNYIIVVNIGPSTGGNVWLSWFTKPGAQSPGSVVLGPYGNPNGYPSQMEFGANGGVIPQMTLMAMSDGGSAGSSPALVTATVF